MPKKRYQKVTKQFVSVMHGDNAIFSRFRLIVRTLVFLILDKASVSVDVLYSFRS